MTRTHNYLLLVGLLVLSILSIVGVAPAQDADGDGVDDANDICPATDPQWEVTAEGCADRDQDGVSDYEDQCPGSHPTLPVNDIGCYEHRYFQVQYSDPEKRPFLYYGGYPWNAGYPWANEWSSRYWHMDDDPVIVSCPIGAGGNANSLLWLNVETKGRIWFRAHEDGHVELWTQADIDATGVPNMYPWTYDLDPCDYPTATGSVVTAGMDDPAWDGMTITISELADTDHDNVLDADDNCADTPPGAVLDPCNLGCAAADADGDGVPDYQDLGCGDSDIDGDGKTDDFWFSAYCDLCPDSDPGLPVDVDGCLDTDGDGVADTVDNCADTPLGATVSIDGCTDADGDGVNVPYDLCADTPGGNPVNEDGCTDTDGDGLPDTDDACPDPCAWVDENGCPDRDLDGVADAADSCPDTSPLGAQVCPDGCVDANDADGDGVWDCADLCNDPCTYVTDTGCPDSDLDGVANTGDFCPDTPSGRAVDPCGCDSREILVETEGPLWKFIVNSSTIQYPDEPYLVDPLLVPHGRGHHMAFGTPLQGGPGLAAQAWFSLHPDGIVQLWLPQELDYWNKLHLRPGGCPITGENLHILGNFYGHLPCEHPTTANLVTVPSCPLCPKFDQQNGFDILAVWNIDTDGDGVQDPIDQCPGSDPNLVIGDDGCVYVPVCDDFWHPSPIADIDGDCYVGPNDVVKMAEQWLDCVHPLDAGCMQLQPSPEEMYPDIMYMPHCWDASRTIDGLLGDWTDPCWIDLDHVYYGEPCDMTSARYTVCWDPCEDLIYSAIQVVDTDHVFETAPLEWDSSDRVEIYVQADPNGGSVWGSSASGQYDKAQQYIVGYQNIIPGWAWGVFGHGTYIPGDFEPGDADFTYYGGARISGDTITYEVSAKAWQWYSGNTPVNDPNVVRQLEPGLQVGFDVVADSRWGTLDPCDAVPTGFGMRSANPVVQKYIFAENFQRWELLDYDGSIVPPQCGDWGILTADIAPPSDCYVDMTDFMTLTTGWMDCTNPQPPCLYKPTQPF